MNCALGNPNKPLHKCTLPELRAIAHEKMLPCIDRMERHHLMENIRIVTGWEAMKTPDMEKTARLIGCRVKPGGSRESLLRDMMNHTWGDPEEKPKAAAVAEGSASPPCPPTSATPACAPSAGQQPPPAATASAPSAGRRLPRTCSLEVGRQTHMSARRGEEALAAQVRRIQDAKDFRTVLGFANGEPTTVQRATSLYRQLMQVLHPDKRTDIGEADAGGVSACKEALERVMEANRDAQKFVKRSPSIPGTLSSMASASTSYASSDSNGDDPSPPAWRPPSTPTSPPSSPADPAPFRFFGWGPLDPLPEPHSNFGLLRVVMVS